MNTKYLIIGASAAGLGVATKLRDLDPMGSITCITAEAEMPYNRCLLADYLAGSKTIGGVCTKPQSFFDEKNITLMLNAEAMNLNAANKIVALKNSQTITYEKLFIGTGRSGRVMPIPGANASGVFPFYDLRDAVAINNYVKQHNAQHAVVVGGGLSGLECADALAAQGLTIDLIHRNKHVLNHQLDAEGSAFLMALMQKKNVTVHTNTTVSEIAMNGSRAPLRETQGPQDDKKLPEFLSKKVILATSPCHPGAGLRSPGSIENSSITTDMVIFTLGGKINSELAVQAHLTMHENGIVVDENMQTSDPSIFAGGDVCAVNDLLTNTRTQSCLWTDAVMQGLAAAYGMTGQQRKYLGTLVVTSSNIYGITFVTCGPISNPPTHYTKTIETGEGFHHTYLFDGEKLKGFALVGAVDNIGALRKRVMDGLR